MKGFRHAALVVTAAYAITYGVLVFIESRWIEAYQLAKDHAKFPPQAAWIFAALHATMIFGAIAIIGFLLGVLWFICECFRSRRRRVPSQPLETPGHSPNESVEPTMAALRQVGRQNYEG